MQGGFVSVGSPAQTGLDSERWLMAEHLAGPALGELGEVSLEEKPRSWSPVPGETKTFASWPACAVRGFPGNCEAGASRGALRGLPRAAEVPTRAGGSEEHTQLLGRCREPSEHASKSTALPAPSPPPGASARRCSSGDGRGGAALGRGQGQAGAGVTAVLLLLPPAFLRDSATCHVTPELP